MGLTVSVAKEDDGLERCTSSANSCARSKEAVGASLFAPRDKRAAPPDRHQPGCFINGKPFKLTLFLAGGERCGRGH